MSQLLSYETIVKASEGDLEAVATVLSHYVGYICACAKMGGQINTDMQEHIIQRLVESLLKTKSGYRKISMSDPVYQAFERVLKNRGKKTTITVDGYTNFLFLTCDGMPKVGLNYNGMFKTSVKKYKDSFEVCGANAPQGPRSGQRWTS